MLPAELRAKSECVDVSVVYFSGYMACSNTSRIQIFDDVLIFMNLFRKCYAGYLRNINGKLDNLELKLSCLEL